MNRNPVDALWALRDRIRPLDPLGTLLIHAEEAAGTVAYNPADVGRAMINAVDDFEETLKEVEAWFDAQKLK